ncbi:MAG TPA: BTAD domain-containing putative transcriptional regulator [Candidatus Limnocylindria bacterium]|nr:BTAD domain-containing putative transcriptional regulator [Candidatus Limnocylindria bacterium]
MTLPDDRHEAHAHRPDSPGAQSPVVVPAKVRIPAAEALPRERLEAQLAAAVANHRLTLVIAPAGAGKTTLLARFAASTPTPVAWYRAETWDDDPVRMLRHLEAALTAAVPGLPSGWDGVEDAARALEQWSGGPATLVIDDLHALEGTAAEAALSRFVDYVPPWLAILAASRVRPDFNLPRLRVSGDLLQIEGDDLRFRSWEVERLFRDFYQDPVPPGELAVLARRTEGWAAGLQLFHLATRGKSADERRRILGGAGSSTRLLREYLARNVLAELPEELRRFLVDTCVLVRLTGDLCDELLERRGSALLLEELARRQLFTVAVDESDGSFRYHEVLRSHLDRMLVEEVGEAEARLRHQRAASLLERSGDLPEALVGYCRAEDWAAVSSLVGNRGEQVADGPGLRLELLPPALVRDSPWLALASARRARSEGRWPAALDAYARAETAFGASTASATCRRERLALAAWLDPVAIPPSDWTGVLRSGLVREPMAAARDSRLDADHRQLVRGLLLLAAGEVAEARRALTDASQQEELEPALGAAAAVGAAVAALLIGEAGAERQLADAIDIAERTGLPWLARMGRVAAGLTGAAIETPATGGVSTEAESAATDPWGALLEALVKAWVAAPSTGTIGHSAAAEGSDARIAAAERAAALARRLGSGVLEALARGLAALGLAEAGAPDARDAALAVESLARVTGTSGPRLLAYAALAMANPGRRDEYELLAGNVARETGFRVPPGPSLSISAPADTLHAQRSNGAANSSNGHVVLPPIARDPQAALAAAGPSALDVRAFGGFAVEASGRPVPLDKVKPRARAVLRFLAVRPGTAIHREVIQEALWPDVDSPTGARSLHVAVSALRGLFAEAMGGDSTRLIAREGDAYRLAVEPDQVDVGRFERHMARARAARNGAGEAGAGTADFASALDLYHGDLLPQDGPAEWAVERREHFRRDAVEAATIVAEDAFVTGDLDEAIRVCRRGLELDRFHDPLWRVLIAARDQAGDAGAASRDRREYASILEGLGLSPELAASSA